MFCTLCFCYFVFFFLAFLIEREGAARQRGTGGIETQLGFDIFPQKKREKMKEETKPMKCASRARDKTNRGSQVIGTFFYSGSRPA